MSRFSPAGFSGAFKRSHHSLATRNPQLGTVFASPFPSRSFRNLQRVTRDCSSVTLDPCPMTLSSGPRACPYSLVSLVYLVHLAYLVSPGPGSAVGSSRRPCSSERIHNRCQRSSPRRNGQNVTHWTVRNTETPERITKGTVCYFRLGRWGVSSLPLCGLLFVSVMF